MKNSNSPGSLWFITRSIFLLETFIMTWFQVRWWKSIEIYHVHTHLQVRSLLFLTDLTSQKSLKIQHKPLVNENVFRTTLTCSNLLKKLHGNFHKNLEIIFENMHLKVSSAKYRSFVQALNVERSEADDNVNGIFKGNNLSYLNW